MEIQVPVVPFILAARRASDPAREPVFTAPKAAVLGTTVAIHLIEITKFLGNALLTPRR
jgi:hypothetical protein